MNPVPDWLLYPAVGLVLVYGCAQLNCYIERMRDRLDSQRAVASEGLSSDEEDAATAAITQRERNE